MRTLFAIFALLLVASCATPFNAKVSRFQALPAPAGETFVVQAADPRLQGGIEFSQYARLVSTKLIAQGYRPAENPAQANLVVRVDYDIDRGRERVVSNGNWGWGPAWGPWGPYRGPWGFYGGNRFAWGFYDPFLFGPGGFNDVQSYTVYTSELRMEIDRTDNGQRLFEGRAQAQSRDNNLPYLVPRLVEAMFTGFPGNSGETVKITIAPERRR